MTYLEPYLDREYNNMTREERIKLAIEKGFTYDEMTGKIYGIKGKEITAKLDGYINITLCLDGRSRYNLKGHQLAYYIKYGRVVDYIDHKDGDRTNNKIDNLREVTIQQNQHNRNTAKGYTKHGNKWQSQIKLGSKSIYIGRFNTEKEAHQAYLEAKEKYHLY